MMALVTSTASASSFEVFRRGLRIAVACAALWWVLTEGHASSWIIGVPAVIAAAAGALALTSAPRAHLSVAGAIGFLPYFVWRSLAGGVDVGLRAMRPSLPISPALARYRLRLPATGAARVFFVNALSLLPGTLAADLNGDVVTVHTLSDAVGLSDLQHLEAHVARIFGHSLARVDAGPDVRYE